MSTRYGYLTVDVFTEREFSGNPVAVMLDAKGLSTDDMHRVAAEFNYSESTFVLPPDDPSHTARVRIFTPRDPVRRPPERRDGLRDRAPRGAEWEDDRTDPALRGRRRPRPRGAVAGRFWTRFGRHADGAAAADPGAARSSSERRGVRWSHAGG